MGKPITGWWDNRSKRYYARLGERSEASGKRAAYMLCHADGEPIAYGQAGAKAESINRRLAEIERIEKGRGGVTVAELCQEYLDWLRVEGRAPRTIETHLAHLQEWCKHQSDGRPVMGSRLAGEITLADLTAHRKAMEARGNQTGYVRLRYASILAAWNWADRPVEERVPVKLIKANPFADVARPKAGKGRNKSLPWGTTRRIIRAGWGLAKNGDNRRSVVDTRRMNMIYLRFVASTGCRPGEAAKLKWSQIDLDNRVAVFHGKTTGRTGKERIIAVPVSLANALRRISLSKFKHDEYVFIPASTKKQKPPSARDCTVWFRLLRIQLIERGFEMPEQATLYWARHEYQSFGLEHLSEERVSAVAGNSPQVLRSTYQHLRANKVREDADTIDRERRKLK
jgi:integrase